MQSANPCRKTITIYAKNCKNSTTRKEPALRNCIPSKELRNKKNTIMISKPSKKSTMPKSRKCRQNITRR